MSTKYQFIARTDEAYVIKTLFEIFSASLPDVSLKIGQHGLSVAAAKQDSNIFYDLNLESDKFVKYKVTKERMIGIDTNRVHTALRSVKKKDSMLLYIRADEPDVIVFHVENVTNNRVSTTKVQIKILHPIAPPIPNPYDESVSVQTSEYQKLCKDFVSMSTDVSVETSPGYISFRCGERNDFSRDTAFGVFDEDNDDDSVIFSGKFKTRTLSSVSKVMGLAKRMTIYSKEGNPLHLKIPAGSLGNLSIYIAPDSDE